MQIYVEQLELVWRDLNGEYIVFGFLKHDIVYFLGGRPVNSVVSVICLNDELNIFQHFKVDLLPMDCKFWPHQDLCTIAKHG